MIYILAFVLFIILTPGVLYKIPKNMTLMKITLIHALIFTILFLCLHKFNISKYIENFEESEESEESEDKLSDDIQDKTKKVSQIFSKMTEEHIKKFDKLKIDEFDAFTKYISKMNIDDIEKFTLLPINEIMEKINKSETKK